MSNPVKATQAAFLVPLLAVGACGGSHSLPKLSPSVFAVGAAQDAILLSLNAMKRDSTHPTFVEELTKNIRRVEAVRDTIMKIPAKDRSDMSPAEYEAEITERLKAQYAQFSASERKAVDRALNLAIDPTVPKHETTAQMLQELAETDVRAESEWAASIMRVQGVLATVPEASQAR